MAGGASYDWVDMTACQALDRWGGQVAPRKTLLKTGSQENISQTLHLGNLEKSFTELWTIRSHRVEI